MLASQTGTMAGQTRRRIGAVPGSPGQLHSPLKKELSIRLPLKGCRQKTGLTFQHSVNKLPLKTNGGLGISFFLKKLWDRIFFQESLLIESWETLMMRLCFLDS